MYARLPDDFAPVTDALQRGLATARQRPPRGGEPSRSAARRNRRRNWRWPDATAASVLTVLGVVVWVIVRAALINPLSGALFWVALVVGAVVGWHAGRNAPGGPAVAQHRGGDDDVSSSSAVRR